MKTKLFKDPTFWTILAIDLAPVLGYYIGHWHLGNLVFLYWAETIVLFLIALASILIGRGPNNGASTFWGLVLGACFILIFYKLTFTLDPRLSPEERNRFDLITPKTLWEDKVWLQVLFFSILHWAQFFERLIEQGRSSDKTPLERSSPRKPRQALVITARRMVILLVWMLLGILLPVFLHDLEKVYFLLLGSKVLFDLFVYWKPVVIEKPS